MAATHETTTHRIGPPRVAINHVTGSLHDEEAAKGLGFRGTAVGGTTHMDVFAPLLVETYGAEWFERGALSVMFLNVIVSGEAVQAVVERPATPAAQVGVLARRADDHAILAGAGTASLRDHSRSALATRGLRLCDESQLRMLKGVKPGQSLGQLTASVERETQDALLASGAINEPLDWYRGASPWGGPIACVSQSAILMLDLVNPENQRRIAPDIGESFGMFGAIELAYERGPVFLDRPYTIEGTVVGVGHSPQTEYLWWDATARDERGETAVRMRQQLRFLKASSPLYPELSAP
ncbi:MAG: hypothetical protein R3B97_07445 [Dehalococcoidia bacterium]|nr:hypothetical protein [Dehalococcoidia bacterium]MCB9485737.1 hypothetical protein [Thermoflexaceae bacterium]